MNELEKVLAIEEIKRVKARYFYGLDHKDWSMWRRDVFAPDARMEVPEIGAAVSGLENVIAWVAERMAQQDSIHHGHMPDIEFTSDTTAKVIWAMEDRLYWKGPEPATSHTYLHGFGHYHETYAKLSVGWRITSTRLTRLRAEAVRIRN
jgi:hypothetical protein